MGLSIKMTVNNISDEGLLEINLACTETTE